MSTAKPAHLRTSSRRQQLVNAALVGAVVVVLGFASGIGVETTTSAQQPSAPTTATSEPAAPATAPASTRPPINYVGVALPPPPSSAPVAATQTSTPTTSAAPLPSQSTTTKPRIQTTKPPTTPCSSNVLDGLLNTVVGLVLPDGTSSTGGSGLLMLVSGLLGSPTKTSGTGSLPLLGGLLDSTTTATPALVAACSDSPLGELPLLKGTG